MRTDHFQRLLDKLGRLTPKQLAKLHEDTSSLLASSNQLASIEQAKPVIACAHCGSGHIVRNGHNRGLQRYLCRVCNRTFNVVSRTPLSHLKCKQGFLQQADCMAQSLSIRATARALGVAASTAFRWRHRFLEQVVDHQPIRLTGLLEADEMYLPRSYKGSRRLPRRAHHRGFRALPAMGRNGREKRTRADLVPVMVGRLRGQRHVADHVMERMNGDGVLTALKEVVSPDSLLCTDGNPAFLRIQKALGVPVKSVATKWNGPVLDNIYHVQSVNSYHERLKTWLQRKFRGVATKYLPNYLAWRRVLEWFREDIQPNHFIASALGRQVINA